MQIRCKGKGSCKAARHSGCSMPFTSCQCQACLQVQGHQSIQHEMSVGRRLYVPELHTGILPVITQPRFVMSRCEWLIVLNRLS